MIENLKSQLKISLKRNGQFVSTNTSHKEENCVEKMQTDFIKIGTDCERTYVYGLNNKTIIIYTKKNSTTKIGETILENDKILRREAEETKDKYIIYRKEEYSKKQVLRTRLLLIYPKGGERKRPERFCYESYDRYGKINFCATNIDDSSISAGHGDYVRYIYKDGMVYSKEVHSAKSYVYGHLSNRPPALYSKGGNLETRFVYTSQGLKKETGFKRTDVNQKPVMIISDRDDVAKFVDLLSAESTDIAVNEKCAIFSDSSCRVEQQEILFEEILKINKNKKENISNQGNGCVIVDVQVDQLEELLKNLEPEKSYEIRVHGRLHLNCGEDCTSLFSKNLNKTYLKIILDLENCDVDGVEFLHFKNCISLYVLILPKNISRINELIFKNCSNLFRIELSSKIESIQSRAFDDCPKIDFAIIPRDNITFNDLVYNSELLDEKSFFNATNVSHLYPSYNDSNYCSFNYFGVIQLPKLFVNGVVASEYAKDLADDVNRNIYELKYLLEGSAFLENNNLWECENNLYSDLGVTGVDAIKEFLQQNKVEEKYKDVFVDKIPLIPYNWRAKFRRDGNLLNPDVNVIYERLIGSIKARESLRQLHCPSFMLQTEDNRIQSILIKLANNSYYKNAMWFLKKSLGKF